jgi:hypothetical protein
MLIPQQCCLCERRIILMCRSFYLCLSVLRRYHHHDHFEDGFVICVVDRRSKFKPSLKETDKT